MKTPAVFLIARGNFLPGQEYQFASYLVQFEPILKEYRSNTEMVGSGLPLAGTAFWDMVWIVKFPNEKLMQNYIRDERVIALRREHEKKIYQQIEFSFVTGEFTS